jgi:AcrR family transcriptional regulator
MARLDRVATGRYHHGDLPRAVLDVTADLVAESGPFSWSLREIARRAGVSHAAPAHHFGDKAGLLRTLATEGFELLDAAFAAAEVDAAGRSAAERHLAQGMAYLAFAREHPGHYDVMFRRGLFEPDDAYLEVAARTFVRLVESAERVVAEAGAGDADDLAVASWALVHGLAGLTAEGFVEPVDDADLERRLLWACLLPAGS